MCLLRLSPPPGEGEAVGAATIVKARERPARARAEGLGAPGRTGLLCRAEVWLAVSLSPGAGASPAALRGGRTELRHAQSSDSVFPPRCAWWRPRVDTGDISPGGLSALAASLPVWEGSTPVGGLRSRPCRRWSSEGGARGPLVTRLPEPQFCHLQTGPTNGPQCAAL